MPATFICAVDVGTASARAGVFDVKGRMLSREVRPIAVWQGAGEVAEHSSEDIWAAVCAAVRAAMAVARVQPSEICALGFDATCSLVLRDQSGGPLVVSGVADPQGKSGRDTISWFDHRAVQEAALCDATGHRVLGHIGGSMSPEMQMPKLMWLKRHRPDLWARMGAAYDLSDFLTWRATGSQARSICTVTAKWAYLSHAGGWQPDFMAAIGLEDLIERAGLPRVATPVGGTVGPLTEAAARDLGLATGTPVAAGMIDAFAGGLGVLGGVSGGAQAQSETLALIAGTSTCVMSITRDAWARDGIWGPYLGAVLPGLWVNEGGQSATGALLDHILRLYGIEATTTNHEAVGARISALLAQGGSFANGLHVLPDFNGSRSPLADPLARGVVHGLTLDHSFDAACALYWRAAVGLAFGMRQIIAHMGPAREAVAQDDGEPRGANDLRAAAGARAGDPVRGAARGKGQDRNVRTLIVAGGHGRSDLLMQLYADVTGCAVELCHEPDAVLAGTAMAAAAMALYPSPHAAAQAMAARRRRLEPDLVRHAAFEADYQIFLRLQAQRAEIAAMARG